MAVKIPQTLVEELIKAGLVSEDDIKALEDLAQTQNKDFGQIVIDQGVMPEGNFMDFKSKVYQLPIVRLDEIDLDKEALKEIPEDTVTFYKIVPFAKEGGTLKVGIVDPEDINALEALKFMAGRSGLNIEKYLIGYKDFTNVVKNYRTLTGEVGQALESLTEELEKKEVKEGPVKTQLEELSAEAPVTRIVAVIVRHAVESRASDIHIEPFEDRVRVRFRVDGVLTTSLTLPRNLNSAIVTRVKILSDLKIDETRLAQDGRFATKLGERKIDFRVSTFPTKNGEKVVMLILDPLAGNITLTDLGLEGRSIDILQKSMAKPFGSILITGPTGSGKSTTLAAMLRILNTEDVNIVTLEDPIEYFVDGVNQSQVHEEIGYTFASGLRHILRQDPDVIMVGEIRDSETAELATHAALTGHIVLSTLHTNNAIGVIPRLVDMGVQNFLIPSSLTLAMSQRLVRRLCSECKKATEPALKIKELLDKEAAGLSDAVKENIKEVDWKNLEIWQAPGCKFCAQKGTKGRIAIFEALTMTSQLEEIVISGATEGKIVKEADRQGMITMRQDGIIKVLKGLISFEELIGAVETEATD